MEVLLKSLILTFLAITVSCSIVFAAPTKYRIESQLFINGKLISSPRMTTNKGLPAEVSQVSEDSKEKMNMKVIVSDLSNEKIKDGILMKFDIEYSRGDQTIRSSPEILAKSGSEAMVSVGKTQTQEEVTLKVIATRE